MSELEKALIELRRIHKKFQLDGSFEKNGQVNATWPQTLERSVETDFFYDNYEPVDVEVETGLTPIRFFDLNILEDAQVGYKWDGNSNKSQLNTHWPASSVVFMDDIGGGKPVIAVTGIDGTPVFASYDVVLPFKIADSLADFFFAFAKLIEVVHGQFEIFEIYNDDDELSSKFVKLLTKEVSPLLGKENFERFFDYFYG
jgi:hypothetical protein